MESTTSDEHEEATHDDADRGSSPGGGDAGSQARSEPDRRELQVAADSGQFVGTDDGQGLVNDRNLTASGDEPGAALASVQLERLVAHSGPLPLPSDFAGYESVLPGAADRILTMAEQAQAAAIASQKTTTTAEARAFLGASWAVSFFPWVLALITVGLLAAGQSASATVTGFATAFTAGPQIIAAARPSKKDKSTGHNEGPR